MGGAGQITQAKNATATSPSPVRPDSTRPHWRTSAGAAQPPDLVVERRHEKKRIRPAQDDDERAERPPHVLRFEIGAEAGDRSKERISREKRDPAAIAWPPFAEQRLVFQLEARRLLDPVDVERCAGEGGGEDKRERSPDHDRSSFREALI